jgi:hypothetical protein
VVAFPIILNEIKNSLLKGFALKRPFVAFPVIPNVVPKILHQCLHCLQPASYQNMGHFELHAWNKAISIKNLQTFLYIHFSHAGDKKLRKQCLLAMY